MLICLTDEEFMRMAIEKAREGVRKGQLPFGACIVRNGEVVSCENNTILQDNDVTAHAEMNAVHEACKKLKTLDLSGCTAYCTCEPCPMCLGMFGLANIGRILYGGKVSDVNLEGFTVLETPEALFQLVGNGKFTVKSDFMRDENKLVFQEWEKLNSPK